VRGTAYLIAGAILCVPLATYSTVVQHDESLPVAITLGIWALLPIGLAAFTKWGLSRQWPNRIVALGVESLSLLVSVLTNAYYAVGAVSGRADPDTAAHLGPSLFPIIMSCVVIFLSGLLVLVVITVGEISAALESRARHDGAT